MVFAISASILADDLNPIAGKRSRVCRVVLIDFECVAIIAIQPILRPEPQEPSSILENTFDVIVG